MNTVARYLAIATTTFLVTGCASTGGSQWTSSDAPLPPYEAKTTVQVQNNNWADMVVYAVRHNSRVRLGMVNSMNSRSFEMPKSMSLAAGSVELQAESIGSRDRFATGPIPVNEGQRVELKIENRLPISTWSVW